MKTPKKSKLLHQNRLNMLFKFSNAQLDKDFNSFKVSYVEIVFALHLLQAFCQPLPQFDY